MFLDWFGVAAGQLHVSWQGVQHGVLGLDPVEGRADLADDARDGLAERAQGDVLNADEGAGAEGLSGHGAVGRGIQ